MAFMDFLHRYFILHFPGLGKDKEKNRELAQLMTRLHQKRNSPYDPLHNLWAPGFAGSVHKLEKLAERLRPVYDRTLLGGDEIRKKAARHLVKEGLSAYQTDLASYSFEAVKGTVLASGKADIWDMDTLFEQKLEVFRQPFFGELTQGYLANLRIAGLCGFDFPSLWRPLQNPPCPGSQVLDPLLDLYFLTAGLDLGRNTQVVRKLLAELCGAPDPDSAKALTDLGALFAGPLEPKFLADTLRCTQEDPWAALKTSAETEDPAADVAKALAQEYEIQKQVYLKTRAYRDFQTKLEALFGDQPPEELDGYDGDTSLQLYQAGLPELTYVQPMVALKGFFERYYRADIRQVLGELFLGLEFSDNTFKSHLVATVDNLDLVWEGFLPFGEDRAVDLKAKLLPALELAGNGLLDRLAKTRTKTVIDGANEAADRLVQGALGALDQLEIQLNQIQADLLSQTPRHLKSSHPAHKAQVTADLDRTLEVLGKTLGLLRLFSVNLGAVKRFLSDPSP